MFSRMSALRGGCFDRQLVRDVAIDRTATTDSAWSFSGQTSPHDRPARLMCPGIRLNRFPMGRQIGGHAP